MIKLFACGDIVNYEKPDGVICSESLAEIILDTDYAICNFEAPIESHGKPQPKSGPHHFQRKTTMKGLKLQGFDLLCLANNHIMDFGVEGLNGTIREANKLNLETIGAGNNFEEAYRPLVKTLNGLVVGFINVCEAQFGVIDYFSTNNAGYAWINHTYIDKQIHKLAKECDFVIVLAHAGLEHYNLPQKEWRLRYKHFCDLGADVVIGSHPHVPQGYEFYGDAIIFYSLGNFYFDSKNYKDKEDRSYSIILKLDKNQKVDFEPVFHHKEKGFVQLSSPEKKIDLDILNEYLDGRYEGLHDQMSWDVFNQKLKPNLIDSLMPIPYDGKFKSSVKRMIASLIGRRKKIDKDLLSLHLIRNEAYYYAIKHALELRASEKYGG